MLFHCKSKGGKKKGIGQYHFLVTFLSWLGPNLALSWLQVGPKLVPKLKNGTRNRELFVGTKLDIGKGARPTTRMSKVYRKKFTVAHPKSDP